MLPRLSTLSISLVLRAIHSSFRAFITLALVTAGAFAEPREDRSEEKVNTPEPAALPQPSDYVFKPIKIEPSPIDGNYTGHFRFVNRRSKPVKAPPRAAIRPR